MPWFEVGVRRASHDACHPTLALGVTDPGDHRGPHEDDGDVARASLGTANAALGRNWRSAPSCSSWSAGLPGRVWSLLIGQSSSSSSRASHVASRSTGVSKSGLRSTKVRRLFGEPGEGDLFVPPTRLGLLDPSVGEVHVETLTRRSGPVREDGAAGGVLCQSVSG